MPLTDDTERWRTWSYIVGRYRILGTRDMIANEEAGHLEIYDGDHIIFEADGYEFNLVDDGWRGKDLTGNGRPCIVVEEFSGGAHCCMTYYVLELGPAFRVVDIIETRDSGLEFEDLDGDQIPEIRMGDYRLAYAFASYAHSPIPEIVLRCDPELGYRVAADLMRREPPSPEELREKADAVWVECAREQADGTVLTTSPSQWGEGVTLWGTMLDLIYSGHEDLALAFFEESWPPWSEGKEKALENFRQAVGSSPWYQQLAAQSGTGEVLVITDGE